jgi:hypothetical protein
MSPFVEDSLAGASCWYALRVQPDRELLWDRQQKKVVANLQQQCKPATAGGMDPLRIEFHSGTRLATFSVSLAYSFHVFAVSS